MSWLPIFLFLALPITSQPTKGIDYQNRVIHICSLFTDPFQEAAENPSYNGLYLQQGTHMVRTLKYLQNASKGVVIQGVHYRLNISLINIGATQAKVINRTKEALNGTYGDCYMYFGPFSSGWTALIAPLIEEAGQVMIAPLASAADIWECGETTALVASRPPCTAIRTRRYQRVWGLIPPTERFWDDLILNLKLLGAESVSVYGSDDIFTKSMVDGILAVARSVNLKINAILSGPVNLTSGEITRVVNQLGTSKSDIIAIIPRVSTQCSPFISELKKQNVVAKAFLLSQCIYVDSVINQTGNDLRYFFDHSTWDPRLRGSDFVDDYYFIENGTTSSRMFTDAYYAFTGYLPDAIVSSPTFHQGILFEEVLRRVQTFDLEVVNQAFTSVTMKTSFGRIAFNSYGMNDVKKYLVLQRGLDSAMEIAAPIGSATLNLIYPFPSWTERVFNQHYLYTGAEQAIFGLYAFCILCTFILGVLIYAFKKRATFKAAAPKILLVMVLGTMFLLTGAVTWMMYMDTPMCYLRVWFLALGMTLVFGALVAKTHRIYNLFLKTQLQVVAYTDNDIFLRIGVMLLFDIIVLIIWCAVERPVAEMIVVDPLRPVYNYWTCKWTTMSWVMIGVIGSKQLLIACYGIFLSIQLWKFGSTMFGESKETTFSIYNFTLLVGLIVAIEASLQGQRETLFVVRSLIILLGAMSIISALILPKFKGMDGSDIERVQKKITSGSNSKKSKSQTGGTSKGSSGTGTGVGPVLEAYPGYQLLKSENEQLKAEVVKLKAVISSASR